MASLRTFLFLLPFPLLLPALGGDLAPPVSLARTHALPRPGTTAQDPPAGFEPYREKLPDTDVQFAMAPVRGGRFTMGSPAAEAGRAEHEGPPVDVVVESFWIGVHEVTWAEFDRWNTDEKRPQSKQPDGVSRPTPPYMDMTFNMGRDGYPAICMSHVAARQYCKWLSEQTGRFYRLPTEAEWEFACRAGSSTAYSFGDDPARLDEHAWHAGNSRRVLEPGADPAPAYQQVGKKLPNAFGLYDMHGNVAEWVADHYLADAYATARGAAPRQDPYFAPPRDSRGRPARFPHVARGGSWRDAPAQLRSAARQASQPGWNERDPQIPKSWWYLTEGQHIGFRVVRPLREPTKEERARFEAP